MDYCDCFYQLFGLSFWRHPFTAEDLLDLHEVSCLNVRIGSHDVPGALMSVCRLFFCPHPSDNDSQTRLHPKPKLQSCFSAGEHMKTGIYVSLTDVERQRRKNTQNISKNDVTMRENYVSISLGDISLRAQPPTSACTCIFLFDWCTSVVYMVASHLVISLQWSVFRWDGALL